MQPVSETDVANLSASFQQAITDCLVERSQNAMKLFSQDRMKPSEEISNLKFVVAGGVGANTHIKSALGQSRDQHDFEFHVAPPHLCTDNAAMIAWAGAERLRAGKHSMLDMAARPRWPLMERNEQ